MVRRQERVRGATRQNHRIAGVIDDLPFATVPGADTAQISDIVRKRCKDEMQPIVRGYVSPQAKST